MGTAEPDRLMQASGADITREKNAAAALQTQLNNVTAQLKTAQDGPAPPDTAAGYKQNPHGLLKCSKPCGFFNSCASRSRTYDGGVKVPCLTAWRWRITENIIAYFCSFHKMSVPFFCLQRVRAPLRRIPARGRPGASHKIFCPGNKIFFDFHLKSSIPAGFCCAFVALHVVIIGKNKPPFPGLSVPSSHCGAKRSVPEPSVPRPNLSGK